MKTLKADKDDKDDKRQAQDVVQLEISIKTLEMLFSKGELCAAEVRCLNDESKKQIRALCLTSCTKRMEHSVVAFEFCAYCG